MKAKIKYTARQNNHHLNLCGKLLSNRTITKTDLEPITFITVDVVDIEQNITAYNSVHYYMNQLNIPVGHPKRGIFESVGHTSMSVGDIIEFEDLTVVVADVGFIEVK